MKILVLILSFVVAATGAISTLDWEDSTAELVRWCLGFLFVAMLILFLSGCAEVRAVYDACREGLCR